MSVDEITEAELLAAAGAGAIAECGVNGGRRSVDAELVRRCCWQLRDRIDPRGLRLRSAVITGRLDLAGMVVPFPLRFDDCQFDSPLVVEGAQLHELALIRCSRLPGLLANGVQVHRDLDLSGSHVTGALTSTASTSKRAAVWLCESQIGGRLLCLDSVIDGDGERSIQADRMRVSGNIRLIHRFTARGEIRLIGARIAGSLDLTGAMIESPLTGMALDLGEAIIDGSVFMTEDTAGRRPRIGGRIDMGRAQVGGQFLIRNATLQARGGVPTGSAYSRARASGTVLNAPRLTVGAELTLAGSCEVHGGLDLSMSELSSLSIEPGSSLRAPGRTALDLTNAELLSSLTVGGNVPIEGTMALYGARIHGNLDLHGAILSSPEDQCLLAGHGVRIDGEAELQNLQATGGDINFRTATIGSGVNAAGAQLNNPGGYTLSLHQANVGGSVRLADGFASTGVVVLNRATIEGRLICTGGLFSCPGPTAKNQQGHAIEAISATIRGGMHLDWNRPSPSVDFTDARTSFLADDPENWPGKFVISGFTYERFEKPGKGGPGQVWDDESRCKWLAKQATYDAGAYEQAARVFRQHGYPVKAERILIAQRRQARRAFTGRGARLRAVQDAAYSVAVGYGYRPGRVLVALGLLLALVAVSLEIPATRATMRATANGIVYTPAGLAPAAVVARPARPTATATPTSFETCGDGEVRCLNPVLYAIDTVVPLVSLDQRSTWYPDTQRPWGTAMQWLLDIATLLGWLLSTVLALSLARLARKT
jgi:hypothetical protein